MIRAALIVLALCLCAGCGGSKSSAPATQETTAPGATTTAPTQPDQDAADFYKQIVNQNFVGQYGRVWDTLHPFHQSVVSRSRFVDCQSRDSNSGTYTLDKTEVLDQYDEPVRIPGQPKDVPSRAVTMRLTISGGDLAKPQTLTQTAHAVAVDGQWRWILKPADYRAYKGHRCPPS
jgi:hypothetical protein